MIHRYSNIDKIHKNDIHSYNVANMGLEIILATPCENVSSGICGQRRPRLINNRPKNKYLPIWGRPCMWYVHLLTFRFIYFTAQLHPPFDWVPRFKTILQKIKNTFGSQPTQDAVRNYCLRIAPDLPDKACDLLAAALVWLLCLYIFFTCLFVTSPC